jgi:hypothetical protein
MVYFPCLLQSKNRAATQPEDFLKLNITEILIQLYDLIPIISNNPGRSKQLIQIIFSQIQQFQVEYSKNSRGIHEQLDAS